jgi:hypothetical protein
LTIGIISLVLNCYNIIILTKLLSTKSLRVRVQTEQDAFIDQWVFVLRPWTLVSFGISWSDNRLNFCAVNETGNVGIGDFGSGKAITGYMLAISVKGT